MMSISVPLKLTAHPCGVRPRAIRARAVSITAALRSHHSCAFHVGSHEKNVRERLRTGVKTAALPQIAFPASIADALSVSRNSQTELALGATLVAFALWVLPAIMKSSWENLRANGGAESLMEGASSLVLPTRAFSPKDAQLGAKLRRKAREMATWETSIAQAAVFPIQFMILVTVCTRLLVVTGVSVTLYKLLYNKVGCFVHQWRLPWPAYTAAAWMIIDAATRRARSQLLAAIDAVGGTDARNLEPRLVTGTNAARSALGVPMLIVFLDSLGVTFSAVWGLLGFGGVAVSLGLKDVVSDFIAGVILMVNPTFKVGDTIRAGSVQGTVMGIGATSTTLLTRTGISKTPHTVSNRVVMGGSAGLVNMSMSRARYFDHKLCVSFDAIANLTAFTESVQVYLDGHPRVIHDPMDSGDTAVCALASLGPHGVQVTVKALLVKMGSGAFAVEQGRMLSEIGRLLENADGVKLDRMVDL